MTLDSLSESNLLRLDQYLNSNPYREFSMNRPYFPKAPQSSTHPNRLLPEQQASFLAFHELIDNQKNALTLDRLAYKLRMKSDLNIDTLRETRIRRRRHHHYHAHQEQQYHHQTNSHQSLNDTLASSVPSASTKTGGRQPTSITLSTNTTKTAVSDDLNGIEGSSVRVGTLDDLIKQFRRAEYRLVRRPADYLESASTFFSSNASTHERNSMPKSHQTQERLPKQPQALTEYRFNVPTIPATPSRGHRDPTIPTTPLKTYRDPTTHQGLIYQYRTRERVNRTDLPLLSHRTQNSPDLNRQHVNSLIVQERQSTAMSSHEKRVQELREKSLMRTEKQLCICNKLTIVDPFNSNSEQMDSALPQLRQTQQHYQQQQQQQQQQQPTPNYLFPPVRPFGYFTKKSATTDDIQPLSSSPPTPPRTRKRHDTKKKRHKISKMLSESLDDLGYVEANEPDDNLQILNDTIKSMVSLTELDDDQDTVANRSIDIHLNISGAILENPEYQNES